MDFTHSPESVGEKEGLYSPATSLPRRTCGVWQCKQNHRLRSFRTAAQLPAAHTILISDASRWTRSQPQTIRLTRPDSLPSHHEKNKWWRTEKTKDERKQEDTPLFFLKVCDVYTYEWFLYPYCWSLLYASLTWSRSQHLRAILPATSVSKRRDFPSAQMACILIYGEINSHRWRRDALKVTAYCQTAQCPVSFRGLFIFYFWFSKYLYRMSLIAFRTCPLFTQAQILMGVIEIECF